MDKQKTVGSGSLHTQEVEALQTRLGLRRDYRPVVLAGLLLILLRAWP